MFTIEIYYPKIDKVYSEYFPTSLNELCSKLFGLLTFQDAFTEITFKPEFYHIENGKAFGFRGIIKCNEIDNAFLRFRMSFENFAYYIVGRFLDKLNLSEPVNRYNLELELVCNDEVIERNEFSIDVYLNIVETAVEISKLNDLLDNPRAVLKVLFDIRSPTYSIEYLGYVTRPLEVNLCDDKRIIFMYVERLKKRIYIFYVKKNDLDFFMSRLLTFIKDKFLSVKNVHDLVSKIDSLLNRIDNFVSKF